MTTLVPAGLRRPAALAVAVASATLVTLAGCADPNAFANCTLMHTKYPHGVGRVNAVDHVSSGRPVTTFYRSNSIYQTNVSRDADHDGIACEAR